MEKLLLNVAGIKIEVKSEVKGVIQRFREMYVNYIDEHTGEYFITYEIKCDEMDRYINYNLMPFPNEKFSIQSNYIYFSAYSQETCEAVILTNMNNIYAFSEEYLLKLFAYICCINNKLLFHCAFLFDDENNGYIFYGPSGIGKSTLARNSPGYHVLSDDLVVLERIEGNKFYVYKTPFERNKKTWVGNNVFNIKGFYRLNQAESVQIRELSPAENMSKVVANLWNVNFNKDGFSQYLDLVNNNLAEIKGYDLFLKNDSSFWSVI